MNPIDAVGSMSAGHVAKTAFGIMSDFQTRPPADQILGAGLILLMWCRRYGLDPRDVLTACSYRLKDALDNQNNQQHIYAIKEFMRADIQGDTHYLF